MVVFSNGVNMFNRDIIKDLKTWADKPIRKPLVLRGARQVGKTTAIEMFSKEFENYIYLNLDKAEDRSIFKEDLSVHELIQSILVIKNIQLKPGKTLIFIDEIQNSPVAVKMLRYFYEEKKELYVISAGSLLEILLEKNNISFPVGRIEYLYLYPMTFREFLMAKGEDQLLSVYDSVPCKDFAFAKLLKIFHEYALIGGMPEVVSQYIKNQDVVSLKITFESLMKSYIEDSEKYARNNSMRNIIRHCLETVSSEAGRRIKFHGFGKSNYGSREAGEALRIIEKAMLIYLLYPSTATEIPIVQDYKKSPKLQFIDTGLLCYFAGLQPNFFTYSDLCSFYQGIVAEHVVRQEIMAQDPYSNAKISFWVREKKQANAEVDILLQYKNYVIPVEVKSGTTGTLRSLHQFINNSPHRFAVRLYAGEYGITKAKTPEGKDYKLLNLPYFLAGKIHEYIDEFEK